jgi:hypothetical protein
MHDIPSLVVHLVGVFAFLLAHGTSAGLAFAMRHERDPARMRRLLELSEASFRVLYPSLLLLLVGGVAGGFRQGYWSLVWIWVALGLLVVVFVAMSILGGGRYSELRKPLGLKYRAGFKILPAEPEGTPDEIAAALARQRPLVVVGIGIVGLALFLFLMIWKPF